MAKTCSAFGKYIPRRARPAAAAAGFCSALSIAIYSRSFCSCILSPSRPPSCIFLPFRPVALRSSSSFSSSSFDHRRCCQTTTCTPGPGQLPSCGHPFPSFSPALPLFYRAGLTRPLRAHYYLPFSLSYPHAVIYHRAIGFFPFSSFSSTRSGASSGCSRSSSVTFFYRFPQRRIVIISPAIVP